MKCTCYSAQPFVLFVSFVVINTTEDEFLNKRKQ